MPNSSELIGRSLAVRGQERHNLLAAIRQLVRSGRYFLSNEGGPFAKEVSKGRKEEELEPNGSLPAQIPKNNPQSAPFVLRDFAKPIGGFSADEVKRAIAWHLEDQTLWFVRICTTEAKLVKNIATMVQQVQPKWKFRPPCPWRSCDPNCKLCDGTGDELRTGFDCTCTIWWYDKTMHKQVTLVEKEAQMAARYFDSPSASPTPHA